MATRYFELLRDGSPCGLFREVVETSDYRLEYLGQSGEWVRDNELGRYVLRGEPGAREITEAEAMLRQLRQGRRSGGPRGPGVLDEDVTRDEGAASEPALPTIGLVFDDTTAASRFRRILQHEPVSVEMASAAEGGLQTLDRIRPDVVITDLTSPSLAGVELSKYRRARPDAQVIVIVEGMGVRLVERTSQAEVVPKTVSRRELLATVRQALGRQQLVSENLSLRKKLATLEDELSAAKARETAAEEAPDVAREGDG